MSLDAATATLISGMITAIVTIGGWLAVHYFSQKRESEGRKFAAQREIEARQAADQRADRTRRLEILMRQTEEQIRNFYGPLYSLIQHIWMVFETRERIVRDLRRDDNNESIEQIKGQIREYIWTTYFLPLHAEIRSILKDRLYLIEGAEMPDSYNDYLKHSTMENIQQRLWHDKKISTKSVPGIGWPFQFPDDVKRGLYTAMQRYEELLAELRSQ